jgi:hypothetical protein
MNSLFLIVLAPFLVSVPGLRVSEVTIHGDMDCFKVETPRATYFYGKKGAGFASILDKDGRDWISYRPGGQARGEYRGLPKCGQPTKFFHCGYGYGQYRTDNAFTSRVTAREDDHVRIESETRDGRSACTWDFYPEHATLTLFRIGQPTFWFLYEGTPGGKLDATEDFVIRPDGRRTTLDEPWSQTVPWVCFGAAETPVGLVLVNHQRPEPAEVDSYVSWPFRREADGSYQDMTVFGFGRKGYKELVEHVPDLKGLPARFSIGFVDRADLATARAACERLLAADEPESLAIFNGKDLNGWSGDPEHWTVEDGAITGSNTAEKPLAHNSFLIWRGGEPADFELRFRYRIVGGNSGVQYRSKIVDAKEYVVHGYQADIDSSPRFTGMNYEEGGRTFLARRGERVTIARDGTKTVESIGDPAELQKKVRAEDWNDYLIIARGHRLQHFVNDVLLSEVIDDQEGKAAGSGVLAIQLHSGPPMKVQLKDIRLKELK